MSNIPLRAETSGIVHGLKAWRSKEFRVAILLDRFLKTKARLRFYPANAPAKFMVEADGIEPTTSCLQSTRSPN